MTALDRIEALRAGLIVPLIWVSAGYEEEAVCASAVYKVIDCVDDTGPHFQMTVERLGSVYASRDTLELAKAAAQSDYSTRILSALHPDLDAMLALMAEAVGALDELATAKPDVLSGRAQNPEDDMDDMIDADYFAAFQTDARAVLAKIAGGAK